MLATFALVLLSTALAAYLGARLASLLAPLPVLSAAEERATVPLAMTLRSIAFAAETARVTSLARLQARLDAIPSLREVAARRLSAGVNAAAHVCVTCERGTCTEVVCSRVPLAVRSPLAVRYGRTVGVYLGDALAKARVAVRVGVSCSPTLRGMRRLVRGRAVATALVLLVAVATVGVVRALVSRDEAQASVAVARYADKASGTTCVGRKGARGYTCTRSGAGTVR